MNTQKLNFAITDFIKTLSLPIKKKTGLNAKRTSNAFVLADFDTYGIQNRHEILTLVSVGYFVYLIMSSSSPSAFLL